MPDSIKGQMIEMPANVKAELESAKKSVNSELCICDSDECNSGTKIESFAAFSFLVIGLALTV